MKKSLIVILILTLLLPSVLAIEVTTKDEIKIGETFQAKFSGNFIDPVLRENVAFYRTTGGRHTLIPAEYDVIKIDEEYYVWAILPEATDNYTVEIRDIRYKMGTSESTDDVITPFSVTEELASFQINPGMVYTNGNFEIAMQNMLNEKISIDIITSTVFGDTNKFWFFEPIAEVKDKVTFELKSGEGKSVDFRVDAIILPSQKDITITSGDTSYTVPVYVFRNVTNNISLTIAPEIDYRFGLVRINTTMTTSVNKTKIVYIKNHGEDDIENITISISGILKRYVELSLNNISKLRANESKKIELYFKTGIEEKEIEGQLKASVNSADYVYLPIFFNIVKGYIPADVEDNGNGQIPDDSCYKCSTDEVCDVELDENECCQGLCEAKEEKKESGSSTGKIVGWVIIIAIIGFLIWFFKFKYKGTKRKEVALLRPSQKKKFSE